LVAGEHVPDRLGEPSGDVDLGHLGAPLLAEPALVALVALGVGGVAQGVHARPAQTARAVLGKGAAAVLLTGLADPGAEAGVAGRLGRAPKAADVADLGGDRVGEDPADPGTVKSCGR
jgi:hypothetical protein